MGAKFLCCLPVRLGVLVVSFCQFFLSILAAGLLWWALHHDRKGTFYSKDSRPLADMFCSAIANDISTTQKISAMIYAITYTVVALTSCAGSESLSQRDLHVNLIF
jgi:hypothetical protein